MVKRILLNAFLIILISSLFLGYINENPTTYFQDSEIVNQLISASSEDAPLIEAYLTKRIWDCEEGNRTLFLAILVDDSDGVDTVLVGFSYDNIIWDNSTMNRYSATPNLYAGEVLVVNISTENPYQEVYIQYTANDTLGNDAATEICLHGIRYYPYTANSYTEYSLFDTPDLWYVVGTTDHSITWTDNSTPLEWDIVLGSNLRYNIRKDGHLFESWIWNHKVTLSVDDLGVGSHVYRLSWSFGPYHEDSVTVHVVETIDELPTTVSISTSAGPNTETENPVGNLFLSGVIVVSFIVLILFLFYYRKHG